MPRYRLIFPNPPGVNLEHTPTARIDTGDAIYRVGDEIEYEGTRWRVSKAPREEPESGETADLMVWPAD